MKKRSKNPKPPEKELSDLELAVMNVVWDLGECSSTDVVSEFTKRRPLAPTTIRTVLTNIEKKGYIQRVPSLDRGHRYRPTVDRGAVAARSMKSLVSNLFQGSPGQALLHLLKDERLETEDLEEVRRLLSRSGRTRGRGERKDG